MRIVALVAAHNERRFIDACLRHLHDQGVDAYLIDNCSEDETVAIAERRLGRGLIGIESFPRGEGDTYDWQGLLTRKEELARTLDADWFIHVDPDEVRLPPPRYGTLAEAAEAVEMAGYNAVDFTEFTFIPPREDPDHDHPEYERTLRTYYPFAPGPSRQLKMWKADDSVELAWSAGHTARFPGVKTYPQPFALKHYVFLSRAHAVEKYVERRYSQEEVDRGWHAVRSKLTASAIDLPSRSELRVQAPGGELDARAPRRSHYFSDWVRN